MAGLGLGASPIADFITTWLSCRRGHVRCNQCVPNVYINMTKIIGIVLLVVAGVVGYQGYQKSQSLSGKVDASFASAATKVTGETKVADHTWYYVGAGALALVGIVLVAKKG